MMKYEFEHAIENGNCTGGCEAANENARIAEAARKRPIENWIVAGVILVFAIVAWAHIRSTTIWYDEAITMLTTSGHARPDWSLGMEQFKPTANLVRILSDLYRYDVHPPFYFWMLAIWRVLFGRSLEVARLLSALFTLGTMGLLYSYAIEVRMKWPPVPVIIYAVSSAGLRYAYNARPYALASFLVVLTLFLSHRKSKWAGICAGACVATHYFAALCVSPIIAIECLRAWKTQRRWAVWTGIGFVAICSPLTILVAKHAGARPQQFPVFGIFRKEVYALMAGALEGALPSTSLWPLWRLVLLLGLLIALVGGVWALRLKQVALPLAYGAFLCGFLLLCIVTHKSVVKMPADYYLGVGAPLLILLIASGLDAVPLMSPVLAAALVAGTVTATPMMSTIDYRDMLRHIRKECNHCAVLVGFGEGGAVPACVLYEAKGLDVFLLQMNDVPDELVQRIGQGRTIFLIPAQEPRTIEVERDFEEILPAEAQKGYFKIDTSRFAMP